METKGYLDEIDLLADKEREASKEFYALAGIEQGELRDVDVQTKPIGAAARKVLTFDLGPDDLSLLLNPKYLPVRKVLKDLGLEKDPAIHSKLSLDWIDSPSLARNFPFRFNLSPVVADRNKFSVSLGNGWLNQIFESTEYYNHEQAGRLRALYFESLSRRPNRILNEILTASAGFVTEVLNSRRV